MSIEYVDKLNTLIPNAGKRYAIVDLDDVKLDLENPRFASTSEFDNSEITEKGIIAYLIQYGKLYEIINSIIWNNGLYWEEWLSCVMDTDGKLIVLEGNRRVAACKALLDSNLLPNEIPPINYREDHFPELKNNISKLRVVIYDESNSAQNYIAAKHTNPSIKKWEVFEQCNYYYSQFKRGAEIITLANQSGDSPTNIKKYIRYYIFFKQIFDIIKEDHPTLFIEDASILPLMEKFMPILIKKGKFGLELYYNEDTYTYSPFVACSEVYNKMLKLIGEAFFIRPTAKSSDLEIRDISPDFRISTDEIKSQKRVNDLIDNDIRIPGLKNYIQEYQDIAGRKDNTAVTSSPKDKPESTNTPPSSLTAATIPPVPSSPKFPSTPVKKEYEFFEDLDYSSLDPQNVLDVGLLRICEEIVKISRYNSNSAYKQFPIAASFLLRSLIEQTLTRQLKKCNKYDNLCKKNGKTPELGTMLKLFLNQCQSSNYQLLNNDNQLASLFVQVFTGHGTKDQLDTIVHRPTDIKPDALFLNSIAKQGIKKVIQTIISNLYATEEADS